MKHSSGPLDNQTWHTNDWRIDFRSLVFILTQLHLVQWSSFSFCLPSLLVQLPARIFHFYLLRMIVKLVYRTSPPVAIIAFNRDWVVLVVTYTNQSIDQSSPMSVRGRLMACRMISMVTRPAEGIAAAPTAAAMAVNLWEEMQETWEQMPEVGKLATIGLGMSKMQCRKKQSTEFESKC